MDATETTEMPRYKCHKEVHALKVLAVNEPEIAEQDERDGSKFIVPVEPRFASIHVGHEFVRKHNPQAGGYYVVYEDGYTSFSPAKAFEDGYKRID